MNGKELNRRLNLLSKECENIKHERKLLATDYERLQMMVKKCGIVCIICLLLHNIVLAQFMKSKSVSVIGLGRFLSPFVFVIFIGSFIVLMIKGFDWFLNADAKYSKMLAVKLEKASVSEELKNKNEMIMTLEAEIKKIENEIYELGGTESEEITNEIMKETGKEETGKTSIGFNMDLMKKSPVVEPVKVKATIKMDNFNERLNSNYKEEQYGNGGDKKIKETSNSERESVDDILNALDMYDEDEDEFENSSELWKKDAMKRYSRY